MTSPARRAADRYVDAVNARDLEALADLFADTVELRAPSSEPLVGKAAALGYYRDLVFAFAPSVTASGHADDGDSCTVQLEARMGDSVSRFEDLFTVGDDGRVILLDITMR